jgi:hypothetical protein
MNSMNMKPAVLIVAAAGALMACNSDGNKASVPAQARPSQVSRDNTGWIQSAQKHNNSGLSMRYRLEGELVAGQAVTVIFEFSGAKTLDAQFDIVAPKTLAAATGAGLQKTAQGYGAALKINAVESQSITFTPTEDGEHFINVFLTQNGQTSATGVMLRVGQNTMPPETTGQRVTTPSGEKLIVTPAK